jgi:hypothetical protein
MLQKLTLSGEKNAHDVLGSVGVLKWMVELNWALNLMESRMESM